MKILQENYILKSKILFLFFCFLLNKLYSQDIDQLIIINERTRHGFENSLVLIEYEDGLIKEINKYRIDNYELFISPEEFGINYFKAINVDQYEKLLNITVFRNNESIRISSNVFYSGKEANNEFSIVDKTRFFWHISDVDKVSNKPLSKQLTFNIIDNEGGVIAYLGDIKFDSLSIKNLNSNNRKVKNDRFYTKYYGFDGSIGKERLDGICNIFLNYDIKIDPQYYYLNRYILNLAELFDFSVYIDRLLPPIKELEVISPEDIRKHAISGDYISTTALEENGYVYSATNMSTHDNYPWVENSKDFGSKDVISISYNEEVSCLVFYNGYYRNDNKHYYELNNRVKRITVSDKYSSFNQEFYIMDGVGSQLLFLKKSLQDLEIRILEVFPGEKYNDTCIDSIQAVPSKYLNREDLNYYLDK